MTHTSTTLCVLLACAAAACGSDATSDASKTGGALGSSTTNPAATPAPSPAAADSNTAAPSAAAPSGAPTTTTEAPLQPSQIAPPAPTSPSATPASTIPASTTPPSATPPSNGTEPNPAQPTPVAGVTCNLPGAASAATPTVWVIGDSTASVYAANLYPRMGWAQPLQDFFAPACATIQDRAISGRSSKSFFDEGAWTPVRDALKSGDFVLIQFGHNDEKAEDPLRFTEPFTTFQQYLSTYIDDSLAKGATPILLTPINRNNWTGATVRDTHGEYPASMRQLAQTRQVALVDTTALTKTYFERIGEAATTQLFMDLAVGQFPNYPDGNDDNTHLQEGGARTVAQIILADLTRQNLPVAQLTKVAATAP